MEELLRNIINVTLKGGPIMIKVMKSKRIFDKKIIEQFEKNNGLRLPKDYIEFLEKYNGGRPETNIVNLKGYKIESFLIATFFGVNLDDNNDIIYQFNILNKRIPKECVPIADVEGGNVICMNLSSEKYGHIYLWDHEMEVLCGERITLDNLYLVAKSFKEFIDMIEQYNPNDEDLSGYEIRSVKILDPEFYKMVKQGKNQ